MPLARRKIHVEAGSTGGAVLKIDLLYEIQIPKPHDERSEYRAYWEAIEQIETVGDLMRASSRTPRARRDLVPAA